MISPDVRVAGFDARQWQTLWQVFSAQNLATERAERGGVVAVTSGHRLRKLVSTERGRIDPTTQSWPEPLEELARRQHARWAAELSFGALDELAERFAERVLPSHDFLTQGLELIAVLRELEAEGSIALWPAKVGEWPVPREHVVLSALDALCGKGRAMVLAVFESGEFSTCLVARRGERGFDMLLGPSELEEAIGLLSGDFRRDYRYVASAVERHVAPLALGCYGELATFRRLAGSDVPGAWSSAIAARDIVLSPAPPVLALPLGLDLGRAAFAGLRLLADRMGVSGLLGDVGARLGRIEGVSAVERDLSAWLGFDPLKLLSRLLSR